MKLTILLLTLLIGLPSAFAQQDNVTSYEADDVSTNFVYVGTTPTQPPVEATAPCTDCTPQNQNQKEASTLKDLSGKIQSFSLPAFLSAINTHLHWPATCQKFSNGDELGSWGQTIVTALDNGEYPELMRGSPDLKVLCPSFTQMGNPDKEALWVLILNGMAARESSCNPKIPEKKGPYGILTGLLQLDKGHENLYADGCVKNAGADVNLTLKCALSMLNTHLSKGENLFSHKSYWQVLFPEQGPGKNIQNAIRSFPPCQNVRM